MTITLFKTGIKVTGSTITMRNEINDNYGNGLEWNAMKDGSFVLLGLFGVAQLIIEEYNK